MELAKDKSKIRLHFVGVGGIGMSGIARVFLQQGYSVSGSDLNASTTTQHLAQLGAKIFKGHQTENVSGTDVVVMSSAVKADNPEIIEAHRLRIPVIPRAEMLGELMRGKIGIAIAGSHGKTTATSMLAAILTAANLDPTLVIGGKVDSLGGNAKLGGGQFVLAEADESDKSFLHLPATFGMVTNIDNDHLDFYKNLESIDQAFLEFVGQFPFYGLIAVCGDDPGVKRCLSQFRKPIVSYGFSESNQYYAKNVQLDPLSSTFTVIRQTRNQEKLQELGKITLPTPGSHNVLNALGCVVLALALDVPFESIQKGLLAYQGVQRRFQICHHDKEKNIAIVDDYGHHPTEIRATLKMARNFWKGRIITVFQPHRYTRTLHCREGFLTAFSESELIFITDIFAAGESPLDGVTSENLVRDLQGNAAGNQKFEYVPSLDTAKTEILRNIKKDDLVICFGAGSITHLPPQLVSELKNG